MSGIGNNITCSWRVLLVTAERRADRAESGRRGCDLDRDGEVDLRGDELWNNASRGEPEFS